MERKPSKIKLILVTESNYYINYVRSTPRSWEGEKDYTVGNNMEKYSFRICTLLSLP